MKKRDLIGCNLRPGMIPGGMAVGRYLSDHRQIDDSNAVKVAANDFLKSRGFVVRSSDFLQGGWTNPPKVNARREPHPAL